MSEEKPTTDYGPPQHGGEVDHVRDEPPYHGMSIGEYIRTRFTSLKPPMTAIQNPFALIAMLNRHHWAFFAVAFFAWVCLTLCCAACFVG